MSKQSIIVIEDEPGIREAMLASLISRGYQALAVEDGKAALSLLEKMRTPGLFLVDLLMPGEDGWRVVEKIRTHAAENGLCHNIIIISGLHNAQTIAHLESVGFLAKPFTSDQLAAVVEARAA
jgi:CheY-like chemotaxis protein